MIRVRSNTLVEDYSYISREDPALDKSVENFDDVWQQYLDGVVDPPMKPGGKPTVFTLQHIRGKARAELDAQVAKYRVGDKPSDAFSRGSAIAAFALAVKSVEPLEDEQGNQVDLQHETNNGVRMLSEESVLLFPLDVVVDVGMRAQLRTYVDPK